MKVAHHIDKAAEEVRKTTYRIETAVKETQPLVDVILQQDPDLLHQFPRDITAIAVLGGADLDVFVVDIPHLCADLASDYLLASHGIRADVKSHVNGSLLGLICCIGHRVFIFYEPNRGYGCANFTIAHELGHLYNDRDKLIRTAQSSFVGDSNTHRPIVFSETESDCLTNKPSALFHTKYSEMRANAFAAEILCPLKEVRQLISAPPPGDLVGVVMRNFGLSREAASNRIKDVLTAYMPGDAALLTFTCTA